MMGLQARILVCALMAMSMLYAGICHAADDVANTGRQSSLKGKVSGLWKRTVDIFKDKKYQPKIRKVKSKDEVLEEFQIETDSIMMMMPPGRERLLRELSLVKQISEAYIRFEEYDNAIDMLKTGHRLVNAADTALVGVSELDEWRIWYDILLSNSYIQKGELAVAMQYNDKAGNRYAALRSGNSSMSMETAWLIPQAQANIFCNLGDFGSAVDYINESLRLIEKAHGLYSRNYLEALMLKLDACMQGSKSDKSRTYDNPGKILKMCNAIADSIDIGDMDMKMRLFANTMTVDRDMIYIRSICGVYDLLLKSAEQQYGYDSPQYITALIMAINAKVIAGDYPWALHHSRIILGRYEGIYGPDAPKTQEALNNQLAIMELMYGNTLSERENGPLLEIIKRASDHYRDNIRSTFMNLTARERDYYINKWRPEVNMYHRLAANMASEDAAASGYNVALAEKGSLLESETRLRRLISESGDSALIKTYRNLQTLRAHIMWVKKQPIEERVEDVDSLEMIAAGYEKQLVEGSREYGSFTAGMSIDWHQVQKKLGKDDVAVEFMTYQGHNVLDTVPSTTYIAYVVDADMLKPKVVKLFDDSQLGAIGKREYYTSDKLSNLIWEPLREYIENRRNVYFAPAGALYGLAIEAVPGTLMEGKNLYRLSSTRTLVVNGEKMHQNEQNAVLYGGLDYDNAVTLQYEVDSTFSDATNSRDLELATGQNWNNIRKLMKKPAYLPATLNEVESIGEMLRHRDVTTQIYTSIEGTEGSVKKLSGTSVSLLHIATHGFFLSSSSIDLQNGGMIGFGTPSRLRNKEDEMMNQSGLLMSGCGKLFEGKLPKEREEDGLLTALEISQLDISDLDIAVLSACQTALGEVSSEGVFGLQRGFKKCGAKTILMSLWSVDDKATELLMKGFYQSLTEGHGKQSALRKAREAVRQYAVTRNGNVVYPYAHPKFWAAFVLLDALD